MKCGHGMKLAVSLAICVILSLFAISSLASEDGVISTRYRDDSYAWTSDKIYVSHGYFTDDDEEHQDCLGPVHYDVFCADRTTGKAKRLFQSVQAEAVQLFADQDDLYVVSYTNHGYKDGTNEWDFYITTKWYSYCDVIVYDTLEEKTKASYSIAMPEYTKDIAVYDEKLYLITDKSIYCCDNGSTSGLYSFDGKSENDLSESHMVFENGRLYFQEDDTIRSIDLADGSVRTEWMINDIGHTLPFEQAVKLESYAGRKFKYIVANGVIYSYDATVGITMAYDTVSKESFIASLKGYHFSVFTDGIMKAATVEKDSEQEYSSMDYLLRIDENGKLVECMERNELYVKDVSIPVGNGQYTTPVDVSVIEIDRIDLLKYVP